MSTKYHVTLMPEADDFFSSLDEEEAKSVEKRLRSLEDDPYLGTPSGMTCC